jgi:hypothetical protein
MYTDCNVLGLVISFSRNITRNKSVLMFVVRVSVDSPS